MATKDQSLVLEALGTLKFEVIPSEGNKVGGPVKLKVTDETLAFLKGKTVEVGSDAEVSIL